MKHNGQCNIVIDFGNTLCKVAGYSLGQLVWLKSFQTLKGESQPIRYLLTLPEKSHCIFSSVILHSKAMEEFIQQRFQAIFLNSQTLLPIKIKYTTPESLGNDRIAMAVTAFRHFKGKNVLAIGAGTAITYDILTSKGEYVGGAISPGLIMRFRALNTFTGRLPLLKPGSIKFLVGDSTENSILSGVINGTVLEIDGMIEAFIQKYDDLQIILGGGHSKFLHKRLKNSTFAIPNPVIDGLNTILEYNIENNTI
ncbi:MAG TPA: type III pantothenate kinase [Bacteroidales bacterium]|nr:type III pantothenate kinase [Bacteroidales bacterium]